MTNKFSVELTAELTVSDETARRCMVLLEMWMEDNPDKNIVCDMEHRKLCIERIRQEVSDDGN